MNIEITKRITPMNRLATALFISCCALGSVSTALSEGRNFNNGNPGDRMVERLSAKFKLSAAQQEELKTKISEISDGKRCRDLTTIEEIDQCREEHRAKVDVAVKDVLTEQQYNEFQTFRKDRKGHRMERLTQELNLTPQQQTSLREAFNKQRQTCLASTTTDERRGCMRNAKPAMDAAFEQTLTPEQKGKWATIKEQRGNKMGRHHSGRNGGLGGGFNGGPNGGEYDDPSDGDL